MSELDRSSIPSSGAPPGPPPSFREFLTQSVHCAAWLVYCGYSPQQFRTIGPSSRGEFVFLQTPDLQKAVAEYFDGRAEARLREFIRITARLRDVVMEHRRGAGKPETVRLEMGR